MKKYKLTNGEEIYKLPYIKDKRLYAAVMTACSMVKTSGWFNKACKYAADKYEVRESDVRDYVLIASRRGRIISGNSGGKRAKQHNVTRPKVLPCSICGRKPDIEDYTGLGDSVYIVCHICGIEAQSCNMEDAIESWNCKQQETKRRIPNAVEAKK